VLVFLASAALALTACGGTSDDSGRIEVESGAMRYHGVIDTSTAAGVPVRVELDIELSTPVTGGSAGEDWIYAAYGVRGSLVIENRGDTDISIASRQLAVSVFEALADGSCAGDVDGSIFRDRCLASGLWAYRQRVEEVHTVAPGDRVELPVHSTADDGRFAFGFDRALLARMTEATLAADPPDLVAVNLGSDDAPWPRACRSRYGGGPGMVVTADGAVFGPTGGDPAPCDDLITAPQ
jgi:hypothetical protein